jgi:hypothetical protein
MLLLYVPVKGLCQQKFDKAGFYDIMDNGDMASVEKEADLVKAADIKNKSGYQGALVMKMADLAKRPKRKLDLFIAGRKLMEIGLLEDNQNAEFHFLRLTIQEHAPKILKYHGDIERDKIAVQKSFKDLSPVVQHAILEYCKQSKVLHAEELEGQ